MNDVHARASTRNSKFIKATPDALYRAFTNPAALAVWHAPGDMTGEVKRFNYTYVMPSYPSSLENAKDLDAASYALVRSWPDGRAEPKAAYHTVAHIYRGRS